MIQTIDCRPAEIWKISGIGSIDPIGNDDETKLLLRIKKHGTVQAISRAGMTNQLYARN